jgi:zinc transport system ATP-binding protein
VTVPAIEIRGLSAGYGGREVIEGVDLVVPELGYVGIIGPNGGGKTTLLKVVLGLLRPTQGSVRVFGAEPRAGRQHVGYVPQFPEFDRDFPISVRDVVVMGRRSRRGLTPWWSRGDREAAEQALQAVDMADHARSPIGELSGGQRQRVYIARALASDPRVMILDEPTASVDTAVQEHVYELLAELNERMAIVLVTHDIGIISSHVKQVACLNRSLFTHGDQTLTAEMLEQAYQCPVDLIAHGVPHRVLSEHHGRGDPGCCDTGHHEE